MKTITHEVHWWTVTGENDTEVVTEHVRPFIAVKPFDSFRAALDFKRDLRRQAETLPGIKRICNIRILRVTAERVCRSDPPYKNTQRHTDWAVLFSPDPRDRAA